MQHAGSGKELAPHVEPLDLGKILVDRLYRGVPSTLLERVVTLGPPLHLSERRAKNTPRVFGKHALLSFRVHRRESRRGHLQLFLAALKHQPVGL